MVARYGGDEFVILMPESGIEQSRQVAEKLRACIFGDSFLRARNVTASVGIAAFPGDGSTPQELIQVADASMYLSKHQGGNAVSTAGHLGPVEARQWKRDVLEAYLGVTLKRLFSTGPEAFAEIHRRLEQFSQSLPLVEPANGAADQLGARAVLPPAVMETVTSLALAIDAKDPYTQGHSPKVANYSALIAEGLGLQGEQIEQIRLGGMLHDLGKVGVPEAILNKSGPLNPEEWELMKEHVHFGDKLLEPLHTLAEVRAMVLHHHEMFDGSGYPEGAPEKKSPSARASLPSPTPTTPSPLIALTRKPVRPRPRWPRSSAAPAPSSTPSWSASSLTPSANSPKPPWPPPRPPTPRNPPLNEGRSLARNDMTRVAVARGAPTPLVGGPQTVSRNWRF